MRNFISYVTFALGALFCCVAPAFAHNDFHGTVLAIQPKSHEAIISRTAEDGHPASTEPYRLGHADLAKLHVGDKIAGIPDERTKPATLSDVYVMSSTYIASPFRTVKTLKIGDVVPNTPLVDQDGAPFTFADYRGRNVVLAFIYTRCRDSRECPLITGKFAELQGLLRKSDTHLVEVTLDPQYDDPPVLKKYGANYGAYATRWTLGTGDSTNVLNFDAAFGLQPFADPRVGIIHGETLAIVDRAGVIRNLVYTNSWQPSEIIAELNALDGKASNPIARLNLWLSRMAVSLCGDNVSGFSGIFDLSVVIVIFAALGWGIWRLYRVFSRAA